MVRKVLNLLFPTKAVRNLSDYLLNDPSTPNLVSRVSYPSIGNLKFDVKDLNFNPKNSKEKKALNTFITIGNFLKYIQENKFIIKKWSSTEVLSVNCVAGKDLNAFYDRLGLRFYYERKGFKTIYLVDSADVVSHELGHALLDAIRPDFWNVQSKEIWAFHEAFADICSIVSIMQYDVILNKFIEETNDNYLSSNCVSKLAEEVGIFVYENYAKNQGYLSHSLRDPAIEIYKYESPDKLPDNGPNYSLSSECHSYGRVFSSVWYNILCKIYNKELKNNPPLIALKNARDISFFLLLQAVSVSPKVMNYHEAIAKCMVAIAKNKYANYLSILENCFSEWNILNTNKIKMLSNTTKEEVIANLNRKDKVLKNKENIIITLSRPKTMKIEKISILSDNKLNDIEVETASDFYFEFDTNGNLLDEIIPNKQNLLSSTISCLNYIENEKKPLWHIENGKLIRNRIE